MKKTLLSALIAVLGFTTQATAQTMLATLHHNGEIKTFYGATALRDAHTAATSGDVITLSSGTFVSTDITKGITLRGAGMELDTLTGTAPTIITGNFYINLADTETNRLTIESIYHNHSIYYKGTLTNAMFMKSRLYDISYSSGSMKNASFIHCKIANNLTLNTNSSASCINCAIEDPKSYDPNTSNFEFQNCVIKFEDYNHEDIKSSSLKNCLIYTRKDVYISISSSNTVYYCLGFNQNTYNPMFKEIPNSTNTYISDITTIFKTYTGQSLQKLDGENFELTDEAKKKYLGSDGTEVGIYGGKLPFDAVSTNPRITKCEVDGKTTADGKLSVKVEVNGKN